MELEVTKLQAGYKGNFKFLAQTENFLPPQSPDQLLGLIQLLSKIY